MEVWLLGAGALVLIAITLWIVWPPRARQVVASAKVADQEVSNAHMTESIEPKLPPQGDRFEDQYTSVTADLSPGGVMAAVQSMQDDDASAASPASRAAVTPHVGDAPATAAPVTPYPSGPAGTPAAPPAAPLPADRWPEAPVAGEHIGQASRIENFPGYMPNSEGRSFAQPRPIGLSLGALLGIGGAVGGTWLYVRWQRERNKPLNRLRRRLRQVTTQLGERLPDQIDDLPTGAAPVGGVASALVLAGLVAARAMRGDSDASAQAGQTVVDSGRDVLDSGREVLDRAAEQSRRLPFDRLPSIQQPKPAVLGVGFGGVAAIVGGSYVVWRLLRAAGGADRQQDWAAGQ